MKKKIVSIILVLAMLLPFAALPGKNMIPEAHAETEGDGYPMTPIGIIVEAYHNYHKIMQLLTGDENFSEEHYNLILDETFSSVMQTLIDECGIDFSQVWTHLPETKHYAERFTSAFRLNIPEVQAQLIKRLLKLEAEGKPLLGGIIRVFSIWIGICEECRLVCEPVEGTDDMMQVMLYLTYKDGRQDIVHSPVYYNTETLTFTNKDGGPVFLGFYFNAKEGTAWTGRDVWQRNMGYGFLYDLICYCNPFFISFNTQRIKFIYDNKQWMVQLWKGRYFIANGAEIGIYTRPLLSVGTWYKCADDSETVPMSLTLTHAGNEFFSIPQQDAWWLSKFKLGTTAYLPDAMTLTSTVTLKDEQMLNAFIVALAVHPQISWTVNGLDVTLTW